MTFRGIAHVLLGTDPGTDERLEGSAGSVAEAALERHRREDLDLAFRVR